MIFDCFGTNSISFIEVYSLKMIKELYNSGLLAKKFDSELYVFSSSYKERLDYFRKVWSESSALFLNYRDVESDTDEAFTCDHAMQICKMIEVRKSKYKSHNGTEIVYRTWRVYESELGCFR